MTGAPTKQSSKGIKSISCAPGDRIQLQGLFNEPGTPFLPKQFQSNSSDKVHNAARLQGSVRAQREPKQTGRRFSNVAPQGSQESCTNHLVWSSSLSCRCALMCARTLASFGLSCESFEVWSIWILRDTNSLDIFHRAENKMWVLPLKAKSDCSEWVTCKNTGHDLFAEKQTWGSQQ